jgi:hypothetical protein
MADRVAVHRIVVGSGDDRKVIQPGTRFNTDEAGIDAETLKKFESSGVLRGPRDENQRAPAGGGGPREESAQGRVVEGRSGPVNDAVSPRPEEAAQQQPGEGEEEEETGAEKETKTESPPLHRRRRTSDEEL